MPNWCLTNYTIVGDEKDVDKLYNLMRNLEDMKTPLTPNDFGSDWLGCLVVALGEKWQEHHCRGYWLNLERNNGTITFDTETAWCPQNEVFKLLTEKFPSLKYYYYAEEPGCCIYETNDAEGEYYPDRFYVDMCMPDETYRHEYFITTKKMFEWISKQIDHTVNSAQEVFDYFAEQKKENENAYCNLYCILVVNN